MNVTEITLENLFGKTREVKIFDLILPIEGEPFTFKQVVKALGTTELQIKPVLDRMVKDNIFHYNKDLNGGTYYANVNSKRVQALRNLLVTIYMDAARINAQKRLGMK